MNEWVGIRFCFYIRIKLFPSDMLYKHPKTAGTLQYYLYWHILLVITDNNCVESLYFAEGQRLFLLRYLSVTTMFCFVRHRTTQIIKCVSIVSKLES